MAHCVNRIHVIWLGSVPLNTLEHPHRRRLVEWAEANPDWEVWVWTDRQDRECVQLDNWCQSNGLRHMPIWRDVILWGTERSTILELLSEGFYANASDLLRLRILYQWGGLYVDVDVEPIALPKIELPLGIGVVMLKGENRLQSIAPHAIASVQGHELLQLALWQGVSNCLIQTRMTEPDYRQSSIQSQQYGGTLVLTGDLLRPALKKVHGAFRGVQWQWSPWLEAMRLPLLLVHHQENTWVRETTSLDVLSSGYEGAFFPPKLSRAVADTWSDRSLTSVLHWSAQYAEPWMIRVAAQEMAPFENHFGYSPKGAAIKIGRSKEVLLAIPSM